MCRLRTRRRLRRSKRMSRRRRCSTASRRRATEWFRLGIVRRGENELEERLAASAGLIRDPHVPRCAVPPRTMLAEHLSGCGHRLGARCHEIDHVLSLVVENGLAITDVEIILRHLKNSIRCCGSTRLSQPWGTEAIGQRCTVTYRARIGSPIPALRGGMRQNAGALSNLLKSGNRSEEHTSELQSRQYLVCRLLLEKKKK